MDCKKMEDHIFEFIDNCLAPSIRENFSHHLQGCANCRGKLEDYLKLRSSIQFSKAMDPTPVPGRDFVGLVMNRLNREGAFVSQPAGETFLEKIQEFMAPLRGGWLAPTVALLFLFVFPLALLNNPERGREAALSVPVALSVAENRPVSVEEKPLPQTVAMAELQEKTTLVEEQDPQQMELEEYLKVHSEFASESNIAPVAYVNY